VGIRVRAVLTVVVLAAATGCTFPPLATPTERPAPTASPTHTASASPSASVASATPEPPGSPPLFRAGDLVATAIDGLRVRQRPTVSAAVLTGLLPANATLEVVMGPLPVEDLAWYLVRDADPDEPGFEEGWVAAGVEPDPFLVATGERNADSTSVASFAQTGDAEYGPVTIGEGDHAIRWVALDPDRERCQFSVSLAAGSADPVPAMRATIGNDVVPGTLQPNAFDALGVRGQAFVTVSSDCAWTFVVERVPEPEASPTGGGA
jgi:hypothetical protein